MCSQTAFGWLPPSSVSVTLTSSQMSWNFFNDSNLISILAAAPQSHSEESWFFAGLIINLTLLHRHIGCLPYSIGPVSICSVLTKLRLPRQNNLWPIDILPVVLCDTNLENMSQAWLQFANGQKAESYVIGPA